MNIRIRKSTDTVKISGTNASGKSKPDSPDVKKGMFTSPQPVKAEILKELDLLGKLLKHPSLSKIPSLKDSLPPLNEILILLGKSSLNPYDSDVLLIDKFIGSWINKYGGLLPENQKKELSILKNLLISSRLEESDENKAVVFGNSFKQNRDAILWRVDYYREKNKPGAEDLEEKVFCVLNLSCVCLGKIKVSLQGRGEQLKCIFYSDRGDSRQRIRKSLPRFRSHLIESGLKLPDFKISRKKKTKTEVSEQSVKGVRLWG